MQHSIADLRLDISKSPGLEVQGFGVATATPAPTWTPTNTDSPTPAPTTPLLGANQLRQFSADNPITFSAGSNVYQISPTQIRVNQLLNYGNA